MNDITFNTGRQLQPDVTGKPKAPKIVRLIVRYSRGRIGEVEATYLVLTIAFLALLIAAAYPFFVDRVPYEEPGDILRHREVSAPRKVPATTQIMPR